jgi:hypothetical protein
MAPVRRGYGRSRRGAFAFAFHASCSSFGASGSADAGGDVTTESSRTFCDGIVDATFCEDFDRERGPADVWQVQEAGSASAVIDGEIFQSAPHSLSATASSLPAR